eukprot:11189070-Lingulodinium_polyedra.AAC.1
MRVLPHRSFARSPASALKTPSLSRQMWSCMSCPTCARRRWLCSVIRTSASFVGCSSLQPARPSTAA